MLNGLSINNSVFILLSNLCLGIGLWSDGETTFIGIIVIIPLRPRVPPCTTGPLSSPDRNTGLDL